MDKIIQLAISALTPHPKNSDYFDDVGGDAYENLKKSIEELGVLTPVRVSPAMVIISGHQRIRACKDLGIETVPAIIAEEATTDEVVEMQLIASNFGRVKNDPIKQAKLIVEYERLNGVKRGGDRKSNAHNERLITQSEIADALGISESHLRRVKSLCSLPEELQEMITGEKLSPTTAYTLIAKLSSDQQAELVNMLDKNVVYSAAQVKEKIDTLSRLNNVAEIHNDKMKAENEGLEFENRKLKQEVEDAQKKALGIPKALADAKKAAEDARKAEEEKAAVQAQLDALQENFDSAVQKGIADRKAKLEAELESRLEAEEAEYKANIDAAYKAKLERIYDEYEAKLSQQQNENDKSYAELKARYEAIEQYAPAPEEEEADPQKKDFIPVEEAFKGIVEQQEEYLDHVRKVKTGELKPIHSAQDIMDWMEKMKLMFGMLETDFLTCPDQVYGDYIAMWEMSKSFAKKAKDLSMACDIDRLLKIRKINEECN